MLTEQDKQNLKQTIQSNQHEVFLISAEEMDAIVNSCTSRKKPQIQSAWRKISGKLETGASYYASADDVVTLTKLVGDLGGLGAKAYIKTYAGKPHIILKGYPGLRKVLTGTKYGIKNPKVITMGLGKAGAVKAAKVGGIITIVLLTAYRVVDYFLTDQATLSRLVGTLATDIVKVGITTGASIAAATIMGGFALAVGPILAVVVVGVLVSMSLDAIDKQYGITDRIIAGLDELENSAVTYIEVKKSDLKYAANEAVDSVIDHVIDTAKRMVIRLTSKYMKKFISPLPDIL